jgi:hypothetical protein
MVVDIMVPSHSVIRSHKKKIESSPSMIFSQGMVTTKVLPSAHIISNLQQQFHVHTRCYPGAESPWRGSRRLFFLCKILLWFTECHRSFVLCHTSFRICERACDKWFCVFSGNEINAHVLVI